MRSPDALRAGVAWSGLGSIGSLGFLFAETVVTARLLPPEQFGGYVVLLAAVNFLLMAVDFGAKTTVTQLIAAGEPEERAAIVGTALSFRLAVLAGTGALLLLVRAPLSLLDPSGAVLLYIAYLPLMLAAASLDELAFAMLQGFQAYRPMALAQLGRGLARLTLTLVLLVYLDMGVLALVLAWSISFALSAAYQLLALPIPLRPSWRPRLLSRMLRFGAPLQLTRILWFASGRVHVVLLATLAGPAAVAYYAVAARIPEALQNLSDSFVRVYFPTMTTMLAGGQRREAAAIMNRSLALISFAGALGALTTALFSRELVGLIFSEKYLASAPALALLMLALHMTVVVNVLGYTLTADGRPGWSLAVDVVRAGASAIGDLLLIPGLGVTGAAAAAAVAAYAGKPLAVWAVRRGGVPAAVAPCLRQTGALLACAGAGWWLDPAPPYRLLLLALFVAVTAPPLLLARQPVEPAWPAAAEPVT